MKRFDGLRGPLCIEELEERVAPAVFIVQPGEYVVYDLGGGAVGVLYNQGTVNLRVDINDAGAGNAADTITEVEIGGDGATFRASGAVGDINDDYLDVPGSFSLAAVTTGVAINVPGGSIIAGETLDAALPALPFTSGTGAGGIASVTVGGNLNGNLVGGTGIIGPVDVGGNAVGDIAITAGTIGDITVGGSWTGGMNIAASSAGVGNVSIGGNVSITSGAGTITGALVGDVSVGGSWTGPLTLTATGPGVLFTPALGTVSIGGDLGGASGTRAITAAAAGADLPGLTIGGNVTNGLTVAINDQIGNVDVGGSWTGVLSITSAAGSLSNVSIGGNVAVTSGTGTISGVDMLDVTVGGSWTGPMAITATGAGGIGLVSFGGNVGGAGTRAITANASGADIIGVWVEGDVLTGLDISVNDDVFGVPDSSHPIYPGVWYTKALWFGGDYRASGANSITIGGTTNSFNVVGQTLALGTSSLAINLADVNQIYTGMDGVVFYDRFEGDIDLDITNLRGTVTGSTIGSDLTFYGPVRAYAGDTMNIIFGNATNRAAGFVTFLDTVASGTTGNINVAGFTYSIEAFGLFQVNTYNVRATVARFRDDFGMPTVPVGAGPQPMDLVIYGSAYINYNGDAIRIAQGIEYGLDYLYGTLDDVVVYPWPVGSNGVVQGTLVTTVGDVIVHALGSVLTGTGNYATSADDIFITSLFGTIGRTDQTLTAAADISIIDYFGPVAADLNAGGAIRYVAAGTLPGPGGVGFYTYTDAGKGFAFATTGGDDLYGTTDDVAIFDNIAGLDGRIGTIDDDWSYVHVSAQGRILNIDSDMNGYLGYYWNAVTQNWAWTDWYGAAGVSDRGTSQTNWTAGEIWSISASEEVRARVTTTGDIGIYYNGTAWDGVDYSQDDLYRGIVSLHTISGFFNAGGDVVLVNAMNRVGVVNDYSGGTVFTRITAGGDITEVSANGIPHPNNPALILDGDIASLINAGGHIHLVCAGGSIYSADESGLVGGEVADTEISAGTGIDFIIAGGFILGAESRNMPTGRVFTYADDLGVTQQIVVTRGSGTVFLAFGVVTDLELDGNDARVLSTDLIGDITNVGNIDRVIVGVDPGPDGILGTADDIRPFAVSPRGPDGILGTADDETNVGGGLAAPAGIFSVTSFNGTVNQVIATGRIVMVAAGRDINEVTTVDGVIGMTAGIGYQGIGGVNGSTTGLIQTVTRSGFAGSIVAERDINLVQAVSSTPFSTSGGCIVGDILAMDDINLIRTNWFGDLVLITASDNINSIVQYTRTGAYVQDVWVAAGADLLGRGVTGDINRILVGVVNVGVSNPDDADIFIRTGARINTWALRDIHTVRHTGVVYGWVEAGRDIHLVESLHGAAGILIYPWDVYPWTLPGANLVHGIIAGRDIYTVRSGAAIGGYYVPQLLPTQILAGHNIGTVFARADIYAFIDAGEDINRIESDSGFFKGWAMAQDDLRTVIVGGEDFSAGDLLMADLAAGDDILRVESFTIHGTILTGATWVYDPTSPDGRVWVGGVLSTVPGEGLGGNLDNLIAHGVSAITDVSITSDVTVGGYILNITAAGSVTGDITAGRYIDRVRLGLLDAGGSVAQEADILGLLDAGTDINSVWITGGVWGQVSAGRDINRLTALSGIYGIVAAGDDIWYIRTGDVGTGLGTLISAGFTPGADGVFSAAGDDLPSGLRGVIGRIDVRPRNDVSGGFGSFLGTLVRATGSIGPVTLPAGGGGLMSDVLFSAGFAPGVDGVLGTADDVWLLGLGRANLGNIGSNANRFLDVDGIFQATGNIADINSAGILGLPGDFIYAGRDIDDLRAGGTLGANVYAGDDIDSITARGISASVIAAGFYVDLDTGLLAPSGLSGDIRAMRLTGGNIIGTTIVASDDFLYDDATGAVGRLRTPGGGTISGVYISAGYGPGPSGAFGDGDDVVLSTRGHIGNIGSAGSRFSSIDGTFLATRNIYDINSSGKLGNPGDLVSAGRDIDDLRAGGTLSAVVAAGDDVNSITAGAINSTLISAGFGPGANGVFDVAVDDVVTGLFGTVRSINVTAGNLSGTTVRTTGNIGPTQVSGSILNAFFSAGFNPVDGVFDGPAVLGLGGDDAPFFSADIVRVTAGGAITGTSFQASDDIRFLSAGGALGSAGEYLFAGDDMGTIRAVSPLDAAHIAFDWIRAGDLSGTGVIDRIVVDQVPNDAGDLDPTILSDLFASLRINRIDVEAAALGGSILPPTVVVNLNLDTDGDGW